MVQFRPQGREVIAKVVYYGPPLGGKTTNLRSLYNGYPDDTRGELVVVPAGGDRTIFFDFLSLEAGNLRGMKLRVQLYTVPGQVHYNATRQVVLRGIDAAVFVADSQREMVRANRESWENLKDNLLLQGLSLQDLPHVLQYNKRDLADVLSIDDVDALLNQYNAPFYEAVASAGIGVEETLQGVVKLLVRSLRDRFKLGAEHAHPDAGQPAVAVPGVVTPVATPPPAAAGGARIFTFGQVVAPAPVVVAEPIPVAESTRLAEPVPHAEPLPGPPGATFEDGEEPDVTRKVRVPPFGEEAVIPPGDEDPFAWEASVPVGADDDVFAVPASEAAEVGDSQAPLAPLEFLVTPGLIEPPEIAPTAPVDGFGTAMAPVLAGTAQDRVAENAPTFAGTTDTGDAKTASVFAGTADVEFAPVVAGVVAAATGETASSLTEAAVEQPFSEADVVESATAAERLFIEAGFVESAIAAVRPFVETDFGELGTAAAAGFEAVAAGPEVAVAGSSAGEGDTEVTVAMAEGDTEHGTGFQAEGEAARTGANRPGYGETAVGGEVAAAGDDGWPTEEAGEREGAAGAAEADEGGEEPLAVVEIPPSAIRRVVPRALAQIGEVRELEIEVPVPAPWTGGKRMTLQLRLTLVPQEEEHGE